MQNPDDPLAAEIIERRRRIEAADARFRATLSQALRSGEEALQGCVGRHERLRNRNGSFQAHRVTVPKRRRFRRDALV
jgi:hypothetical protein